MKAGLARIAGVMVIALTAASASGAKSPDRALRFFKGPYRGAWHRGGTELPLKLRMPKFGTGKGRGTFEATPCDTGDRWSEVRVSVRRFELSRNGKKLTSWGRATWMRTKIARLGGPNPSGLLIVTAKRRGNRPRMKGRINVGTHGYVEIEKRGMLPAVPIPWLEMVTVGNPGNPLDPSDADPLMAGLQQLGAVANDFRIGKFEVTNYQYATFLNAIAGSDPNKVYDARMATDPRGGITRSGSSPNHTYLVRSDMHRKPVNFVDFWDACRFCNWLHNGRPTGAQTVLTTEDGAYDMTDTTAVANNTLTRKAGAKYFLPTEDEWYKATYHQPRQARGPGDHYWLYPTQSEVPPAMATADADGDINNDSGNIANFGETADWNLQDGHVTTVGSGGPGSASFYRVYDAGGNVREWNETINGTSSRGTRGGSWENGADALRSSFPSNSNAGQYRTATLGFRIASRPFRFAGCP